MNILIAPDKFKGTLTAIQVCRAIEEGLREWSNDIVLRTLPLADGGEGTLEAFESAGGKRVKAQVHDPLMRSISASFVLSANGKTACIEMAKASGLWLLSPNEYDPMRTTTFGTGELIRKALEAGASEVLLGIGGSACNDAGTGMMAALGMKFLDEDGRELAPCGASLAKVARVDDSSLMSEARSAVTVALTDVTNPFYGPTGAAHTYGPQKGATAEMVFELDKGLRQVAEVVRRKSGIDLQGIAGTGAGGGIAGGAVAWMNATVRLGVEVIFESLQFDAALDWADVVISGEGKLDHTSLMGKVVNGVAEHSLTRNKPLILICGQVDGTISWKHATIFSLVDFAGRKAALEDAFTTLKRLTIVEVVPQLKVRLKN